ncbi:DUF4194 domain-containing protein [Pseudomaricurvus alcaniphilus]|uniref:DUF4194 domain-containing protein n=1 Tax=Pseudomaricurvus alcaniphilus TaxID=1166482 RepID=UPI00140AD649|nr:DUF4194 domain-containing protein [Pseudomaricurvus alcaniphilus]NHN36354.1 DUF4194 domain-containing protein [Pseudomaricurvus alcaniphilus]
MLTDYIEERLDKAGLSLRDYQELCLRLLNYGVLCRDESRVEQQLYDLYVRISELVDEYLGMVGIRVFHDRRFAYVRLYPPGARVPGMEDAEQGAFSSGLRSRLRQDEVALLLVLRQLYDKALREGQLDDNGYVTESIESIGIAIRNQLGRSLPEKVTDRKRVFERLRKLRLIQYRQEQDLDVGDAGLKIHPMIVAFVSEEALAALEDGLPLPPDLEEEGEGDVDEDIKGDGETGDVS